MEKEIDYKWKISENGHFTIECIKKKGNHKKFIEEILTWTMKPPHCLT
jgi:hypothetical protein